MSDTGGLGAGPLTAGGDPSGFQALNPRPPPSQKSIDSTKSVKYESLIFPKQGHFYGKCTAL